MILLLSIYIDLLIKEKYVWEKMSQVYIVRAPLR